MPIAPRLFTLLALSILLSACSVNGTYTDSTHADAAKLRYISGNGSATLDLFDSQRCEGKTTGMLNNPLVPDTRRRADMRVPPPASADSYYEIRLEPDQAVHIRANTQGTATVCAVSFTLTPQAGSEYELSFDETPRQCRAMLVRLQRVNGKDLRLPYPLVDNIPAACNGTAPIFPAKPVPLPDTAERTELIDTIIADSISPREQLMTSLRSRLVSMEVDPQGQLDERKRQLGFELPETYWLQYRQNLVAFAKALAELKQRTRARFDLDTRPYLRSLANEQLSVWAGRSNNPALYSRANRLRDMGVYYEFVLKQSEAQIRLDHLRAMAQLDRNAGVCERYAGCWKL